MKKFLLFSVAVAWLAVSADDEAARADLRVGRDGALPSQDAAPRTGDTVTFEGVPDVTYIVCLPADWNWLTNRIEQLAAIAALHRTRPNADRAPKPAKARPAVPAVEKRGDRPRKSAAPPVAYSGLPPRLAAKRRAIDAQRAKPPASVTVVHTVGAPPAPEPSPRKESAK